MQFKQYQKIKIRSKTSGIQNQHFPQTLSNSTGTKCTKFIGINWSGNTAYNEISCKTWPEIELQVESIHGSGSVFLGHLKSMNPEKEGLEMEGP